MDEWVCSPLNVGGGTVVCAHGTFPIPAPATLELLKNAPVYSGEIQKELVTPTGAAIVSVLASRFSQFPTMKTEKIGYGAGTRNFKNSPNVLRLTVGETAAQHESPFPVEEITVLEANVDDMTPQVFGYVMEQALQKRRVGRIRHSGADEKEPSGHAADRAVPDGRQPAPDQAYFG